MHITGDRLQDDVDAEPFLAKWRAGFRGVACPELCATHGAQAPTAQGFLRIRQGEPDECCRMPGEALGLAVTTTLPRLVQRIQGLRHNLEPWSESSAVKALDDQLAASARPRLFETPLTVRAGSARGQID